MMLMGVLMSVNKPYFDSTSYQRYVRDIRNLVINYAKVNQEIVEQTRDYAKESYSDYRDHIQRLLMTANPLDYYRLNRNYLQHSSMRLVRVLDKRSKLFGELNQKLLVADSLMFIFPVPLQEAFHKYRETGVIELVNPQIWNDFKTKLLESYR